MRYINIWQPFVVRNIIYIYHLFYVAVIEKWDGFNEWWTEETMS